MSGVAWLFGIPLAKVTQSEAVEKVIELAKTRRRPALRADDPARVEFEPHAAREIRYRVER